MSEFSQNIKVFRKKINLTQKEISNKLGITERAYQYYESGNREPNVETLKAIADTLDISIDYLLGRTKNQFSHKN